MRYVRYLVGDQIQCGWINGEYIGPIEGDLFGEYRRLEATLPLEQTRLLAPILPGKIIEVGRNYLDQVQEQGTEIPNMPVISLKPPSAVIGSGEAILLPQQSNQVEHEVELAIIIGRRGRWVSLDEATGMIFGFTIANDVTARDLQKVDVHKTRSKAFDTFCPLGPWIETELDAIDVLLTCRVNDQLRQMATTREMIFTIGQLISFVSSVMTLFPGDVILTGTPAGSGVLKVGDRVDCAIEGIGVLSNPVRAATLPSTGVHLPSGNNW